MERQKTPKHRKISQILILSLAFLGLSSCTTWAPTVPTLKTYSRGCSMARLWVGCPSVSASGLPGTLRPDVPYFNAIYVAGPYNVALYPGRGSQNVVIHGDASVTGRTHVYVKDNTLIIRADHNVSYTNHNLANINIRMDGLSRIYFDSPGKLIAKGIRSTRLQVAAKHRAEVLLEGAVRNLDIATYEQARVNTVGVKVKKNLSAVSKGESRIFHHGEPESRNAYASPQSAIANLQGLKVKPGACKNPPCDELASDGWE